MRSVSGTLETAQTAAFRTPYIHLLFTSHDELTTYDLSTDSPAYGNRILLIDHFEEPYNDYATIVFRNYDGGLPTDLRGYWVEIGYGDVTGGGNEYSDTPRLWVKHHQVVSAGGKYLTVLELEGMWMKMQETLLRIGSPPYYTEEYTGDTVYDLIVILLAEVSPAFTLAALVEDDGIINSYAPVFSINDVQPFEDAASATYRLIKMTKSYLRAKASLEFEVKYPQVSDPVNATYFTNQFYEYTNRNNLVVPNHIYVFANAGADELWTDIITAEATVPGDTYDDTPNIVLAPEITTQEDADNRADAIVARLAAEDQSGRLIIPHNCQHELYDYVRVMDSRV